MDLGGDYPRPPSGDSMKLIELLLYVEGLTGSDISIDPMDILFHEADSLIIPNYKTLHNHAYCLFIKSLDKNFSCAENKYRTKKIATCGHRFCGCCPWGIWEHVQPVMCNGKLIAVIYMGTFRGRGKALTPPEGQTYDGPVPPEITPQKERSLKEWGAFLARFIACEFDRSKQAEGTREKQHSPKYYCDIVHNIIALRYKEDLRLSDVAKACHVNPNYLSNLLKASTGRTFSQLLNDQRIIEAQACLKYHSYMSIAEVAAACGFKDSNYFSLVFSRVCGATPSYFRNNWREDIRLARL